MALRIKEATGEMRLQAMNQGKSSWPIVFEKFQNPWECMNWNLESFQDIKTTVRVHKRKKDKEIDEEGKEKVDWETDATYIHTSLKEFGEWCEGKHNENTNEKEDQEGWNSSLSKFDRNEYWGYAAYKYFQDLFGDKDEMKHSVHFDRDFKLSNNYENIGFWFGSKGSNTPCHYDTYGFNIVFQVKGKKKWILFPPQDSKYLYPTRIPYEESSVFSLVQVANPDHEKYPEFSKAQKIEVILKEGEALFVPRHWWHYVESLETTVSINQWFELEEDQKERLNEALVRFLIPLIKNFDGSKNHSSNWINPTEEKLNNQESLQLLYDSLVDLTEIDPSLNEDEFTTFLINSLLTTNLSAITTQLLDQWKKLEDLQSNQIKKRKTDYN